MSDPALELRAKHRSHPANIHCNPRWKQSGFLAVSSNFPALESSAIHRILLTLALILAPLFAFAQSVGGTYTAEGRNPNGSAYSGTVWIDDAGDGYSVDWEVGASSSSGLGTVQGNVFVVNWGDTYPVYYVILPNGELHGT